MFCEKKVAQMAAYLLLKSDGRMAYLKLMKLLYLSDRQSLVKYGDMMSGDKMYSMQFGPILSETLDLIRRTNRKGGEDWNSYLDKKGIDVVLQERPANFDWFDELGELSRADIKIMDSVYESYGHYDRFDLANLTHLQEVCPEWRDPGKSRLPIYARDILLSSGKSVEEAENILRNMRESDLLKELSAQLT
ncbi:SocA family protein [Serratia sp. AXJ-M]|uniref:Panacea domain-containing protein n=1 Tax=Serratia sp. AXJ-M TaxID=2754727 RepID=UPI00397D54FB